MKILHIISSMNPQTGGVCKAVRDIICGMDVIGAGLINEVVCLDDPKDVFLQNDPFKVHALGNKKTTWSYSNRLLSWLDIHHVDYNITIVHGLWQYQSHVVNRLFNRHNIRYFVMPHGMLDPYFQRAKGRRIKALRNLIFWRLIEGRLVNNAQGLLFTCEEEKILARTTFKDYFPKKEFIVGLGIDIPPPYTEEVRLSLHGKLSQWNEKPILLFLSRVDPKKGVDLLIEAYSKLEKEISELPQLVIAGPGIDSPYGKELIQMAQQSDNILFPGMLSGAAKWGAFYCSEAFILPSHQENFGFAVVEALACGRPVLLSNQVNIWREIADGGAGLINADSLEGTYDTLRTFFSLSGLQKEQMGCRAKKVYDNNFTIENASKKIVKVLCSGS